MTSRVARQRVATPAKTKNCTHRWLVETPHGARVSGRCRSCGMTRRFPSGPTVLSWKETFGEFAGRNEPAQSNLGAAEDGGKA